MKLICGLGNPGPSYQRHRHNVGFRVVQALAQRARTDLTRERFGGRFSQVSLGGQQVLLLMPQTYMNLSGEAVGQAARFYKVDLDLVLVVHDELDLPFGRLQLKQGGGAGGHNGLRSISELCGDGFGRLRFGIGKPEGPAAKERVVGHVLSDFAPDEETALPALIERAVEMAEGWAKEGMAVAMNRFNRR